MPHRNIVVIGGSTGGLEAVRHLVRPLPPDLDAALFVVLHTSAQSPGVLDRIFQRCTSIEVAYARDGEPIRSGRIYIAPPDRHLLVKKGHLRVTRGPRENRFRPAVDPLFRTAAASYGNRVIGIVLSGGQDDGAVGLGIIKNRHGLAVVQDPEEALASGMPEAALRHVVVDLVLTARAIGSELRGLVAEEVEEETVMNTRPPRDVAEGGADDIHRAKSLGPPSPFSCPECGGTLWEYRDGELLQYHCHIGHRFSGDGLVTAQTEALDQALWSALRALEESSALRARMAAHARERGMIRIAEEYEEHARESEERALVIRRVLMPEADAVEEKPSGGRQEK